MVVATAGMQAGTTTFSIGCGFCGGSRRRPLSPPIPPVNINIISSNLHLHCYHHHHHHHHHHIIINSNRNRNRNKKNTTNSNFLLVRCSSSSGGSAREPARGFGPQQPDKLKKETTATDRKDGSSRQRKSNSIQSGSVASQAPGINSQRDGKSTSISFDVQFEERLQAVKRSALEQKKVEEKKEYGAIDYDGPIEAQPSSKIGFGAKVGVGVAVVVFGLVFALGDFLPSGSLSTNKEATVLKNTLPPDEKAKLQTRLQEFEAKLNASPEDPAALEGAAVTLTELGEYTRAVSLLEDLTKKKPRDPDALRLLGEVKYELKDYEGSATAYRSSAAASDNMDFEVLRGLTNALLAAKKPDEAVQILLTFRESLNEGKPSQANTGADGSTLDSKVLLDPIQVGLLLGKAYSDWGHISDAVSVYDQIISSHPDDFRGYLAKGIILKENGKYGDAERMFIQARFFAPEGAKGFVDRYSR